MKRVPQRDKDAMLNSAKKKKSGFDVSWGWRNYMAKVFEPSFSNILNFGADPAENSLTIKTCNLL